jgi:hypothetical protein
MACIREEFNSNFCSDASYLDLSGFSWYFEADRDGVSKYVMTTSIHILSTTLSLITLASLLYLVLPSSTYEGNS